MKVFQGVLLAAGLFANAAQAETVKLECKAKIYSKKEWITEAYIVEYEKGQRKAKVVDALIMHANGGPVEGKVLKDDANRSSIGWDVNVRNNKGQRARFVFGLRFNKATGKGSISAKPIDYRNSFSRRVSCVEK